MLPLPPCTAVQATGATLQKQSCPEGYSRVSPRMLCNRLNHAVVSRHRATDATTFRCLACPCFLTCPTTMFIGNAHVRGHPRGTCTVSGQSDRGNRTCTQLSSQQTALHDLYHGNGNATGVSVSVAPIPYLHPPLPCYDPHRSPPLPSFNPHPAPHPQSLTHVLHQPRRPPRKPHAPLQATLAAAGG